MDEPLTLYTRIQELVRNEARQVATEVYNSLGTKYNVAQVPTHSHNGVDSNPIPYKNIVQGNKYTTFLIEEVSETITIGGIANPTKIIFMGFAANNKITSATLNGTLPVGNFTVSGAFLGGENSATLSASWLGTTGIFQVTFSNGDVRNVNFTNGSTSITWSGNLTGAATATIHVDGAAGSGVLSSNWTGESGSRPVTFSNGDVRNMTFTNGSTGVTFSGAILSSSATATLTIGASKRAIINGEINFGQCFIFSDLVPPLTVTTIGSGIPFIQSSNSMYIDGNNLANTRVNASSQDFIYAADESGTIVARGTATDYDNQLGLLTITFVVGTNWKIQGAFTIT